MFLFKINLKSIWS